MAGYASRKEPAEGVEQDLFAKALEGTDIEESREQIEAGLEHPLRVVIDPVTQEPAPYLRVRRNLDALIHRNVFYPLVELAQSRPIDGQLWLGVWSDGEFFPIAPDPGA